MKRLFYWAGALEELPTREYYEGDWRKLGFDYDEGGRECDIVYSASRCELRYVAGCVDYK